MRFILYQIVQSAQQKVCKRGEGKVRIFERDADMDNKKAE